MVGRASGLLKKSFVESEPKPPPFETKIVSLEVAEAGQREIARNVADPLLVGTVGVAEGQGAPGAGHEDVAGRLAERAALAARGVVGANRGTEGDPRVGLAGHVDAEPDARDRAQVLVAVGRAVVVDVVAQTQAGVAEERNPLGRGSPADRQGGEGGGGEEYVLHRFSSCFLVETHLKSGTPGPSTFLISHCRARGQGNGRRRQLCVGR